MQLKLMQSNFGNTTDVIELWERTGMQPRPKTFAAPYTNVKRLLATFENKFGKQKFMKVPISYPI